MTSLAATISTGNIAGVATAIFLGGPVAIFWMWMTALVGMATKFAEAVLAVHYREEDANGKRVGGPMYYIKNPVISAALATTRLPNTPFTACGTPVFTRPCTTIDKPTG